MDGLAAIPDWLGTALFGAITGIVGWVGNTLYAERKERTRQQQEQTRLQDEQRGNQRQRLESLNVLLQTSKSLFRSQNAQARRLLSMLDHNHPGGLPGGAITFDGAFCHLFADFTREERELHQIIRGVTEHALFRVNDEMLQWLSENQPLISGSNQTPSWQALGTQLGELRVHLTQWAAEYHATFLRRECSALVYLGAEDRRGHRFPPDLEPALDRVLAELR